ncbi:MAG: penicillin-binding protein 1A [Alphaproteobacteria bacterium]|jgi:penicillin-binding protein 1A
MKAVLKNVLAFFVRIKPIVLRILSFIYGLITFSVLSVALVIISVYWYYSRDLPSYQQLEEYKPPVISRVYASNGALIGQFAKERRLFYPIENIPKKVSQAFIAAEDKHFYEHPGVDFRGIGRAIFTNVTNLGSGRRLQGASTITQQVMKNFLFQDERPHVRKIKEAILATRFEATFNKDQILELYLNEIFLGAGTYGVASAAQTYFDKKLSDLETHEIAYLAALPKGPNNYHPIKRKKKAILRRNYVLTRMYEDDYISKSEMMLAKKKPLETVLGESEKTFDVAYFVEEIRRNLLKRYGEDALYNSGLMVTSTINPEIQKLAEKALRKSLMTYDKKQGWRGPLANITVDLEDPIKSLKKFSVPSDLYDWDIAVVTSLNEKDADIFIKDLKESKKITLDSVKWARSKKHSTVKNIADVLSIGDVIYVEKNNDNTQFNLRQIPLVNGAIMVMDPHTGRILAQQGGFSFSVSQFNRATQAQRQPGSSFKPFVYAAALEQGFSPNTLVNDGPFYYVDGLGRPWQPENYDKRFLGKVPLRVGLERSRNLMTIRLAQDIGMNNVIDFANRLGVGRGMKPFLPMALGAGEVTLEEMVTAYATFANGGYKVQPVYFDRVQNREGETILTADITNCIKCVDPKDEEIISPSLRIIDPISNYQMVSMLRGVVERGTGRTLKTLGAPIGGKTGTTNDSKDVWFMGFTSDLVFGTYIGYDNPKPMGRKATGGGTAAPLIKDFLKGALKITNAIEFEPPKNAILKRVNRSNGSLSEDKNMPNNIKAYNKSDKDNTVLEAFKPTQQPKKNWHNKKTFKTSNEKDYYKKEHINEVEDMINLGTGGLY